jgi:hypothetical protein
MGIARKLHAHGELAWWLVLILAAVLTGLLARQAGGMRRWEPDVGAWTAATLGPVLGNVHQEIPII